MRLYPKLTVEEAVAEMRNRTLRIQRLQSPEGQMSRAVLIQFQYSDESHAFALVRNHDRNKAQAVLQALINHAFAVAAADAARPSLELLDPASLPEEPIQPNRMVLAAFGLIAGLVLGIAWQVRARPRPALAVGQA